MTMRYKGIEFDTVQELKEFMNEEGESIYDKDVKELKKKAKLEEEKAEIKKEFKNVDTVFVRKRRWKKKEDKYLKDLFLERKSKGKSNDEEFFKALSITLNRPVGGIKVRMHQLRLVNGRKEKVEKCKPSYERDASSKRMQYINSRSRWMMKQYGYDLPKALSMASQEWNAKKGLMKDMKFTLPSVIKEKIRKNEEKKFVFVDVFPDIPPVEHSSKPKLIELVKDMIANGNELKYLNVRFYLDGIMDGRMFHEFTDNFMMESGKIAKYFNVEDKFKCTRIDNKYDVLRYGD